MRHRYQVQNCHMLQTLKLFFDAKLCSTVNYLPNARLYSNPIHAVQDCTHTCLERSCEDLISWMFSNTILWQVRTDVVVTLCKPIWPSYQLLPNCSSKLTPRMNCMSARMDIPSQLLVWWITSTLVKFTSLEHQPHSLNGLSNHLSIKLWLISLPALAFVF